MSDPDRLAEIRQRLAAITPPPWEKDDYTQGIYTKAGDWRAEVLTDEDRDLIAHAPEDIDHLLSEVERLRGLLRRLAAETLLARAVIHEVTWGDIVITERPRLRDALRAWGEDDKVGTPELHKLAEP